MISVLFRRRADAGRGRVATAGRFGWPTTRFVRTALLAIVAFGLDAATVRAQATIATYDVVVYGGSSAGVIAAVQAARMGKNTLLISSQQHVGGMTASGLGTTDIGDAATIGGLAFTFYQQVRESYAAADTTEAAPTEAEPSPTAATAPAPRLVQFDFEPHVAEAVFLNLLRSSGANWILGEQLDRVSGVSRRGTRITAIRMRSGQMFVAKVFIDATYEGDLLAAAGVSYRIGRESAAEYREDLGGVYRDNFLAGEVDPYVIPGLPESGVLPGVEPLQPGPDGTGDLRVQQYNLRLCVTNVAEKRVPFQRPASYHAADYELLRRRLEHHADWTLNDVVKVQRLPGEKADINATASFSTDMAGTESSRWPEASDEDRVLLLQRYRDYTEGLFWFLAHEPTVPARIRAQANEWGLAGDEFADSDHWPWQLYVREARRMIGSYVMTQHDCERQVTTPEPIALGSYAMDSHKVSLFIDTDGRLNTEGFFFRSVSPYPISYRSIIPSATECTNLLVPICVSATHVAYNSLRMEPVYMMLGQSAATAACLAIDGDGAVQSVKYAALASRLKADGQILSRPTNEAADEAFSDEPERPKSWSRSPRPVQDSPP